VVSWSKRFFIEIFRLKTEEIGDKNNSAQIVLGSENKNCNIF